MRVFVVYKENLRVLWFLLFVVVVVVVVYFFLVRQVEFTPTIWSLFEIKGVPVYGTILS
jgi:hypothetical protein